MSEEAYNRAIEERALDIIVRANEIIDLNEGGPIIPPPPPYEPTDPSSPTIELAVTADKAVLVEYVRDNNKDYPVFAQPPVSERFVAMKGKVLVAYPEIILADGRRNVYKLTSSNVVGGDKLPDDRWQYVRVRDVI